MGRVTRSAVVLAVVAGLFALAAPAGAVCAYDPNDPPLPLKQMIRRETTGDDRFTRLMLGRVRRIRDPGDEGGDVVVQLRVREVPVGPDREWGRISDWEAPPGVSSEHDFVFRRGGRYAVVARHLHDGRFSYDGDCGQTAKVSAERLRGLVRLSRHV